MTKICLAVLSALFITACNSYGDKVSSSNIEVYYNSGITRDQAEKTARLIDEGIPDGGNSGTVSFQLHKTGDTVLLKMVAKKQEALAMGDVPFQAIARLVSDSVFTGGPVNFELTDNLFNSFRHIPFRKDALDGFGREYNAGNIQLFVNDLDTATTDTLLRFLNRYFEPDHTISFQISRDPAQVYLLKMVTDPAQINKLSAAQLDEVCTAVSTGVFHQEPVIFALSDAQFNTRRKSSVSSTAAPATE